MRRVADAAALLIGLGLAGCTPQPSTTEVQPDKTSSRSKHTHDEAGAVERPELYEGHGTVLWHEPGRIYINHDEIPGFMDAMAMGFDVRDPALVDGIQPGVSVEFRIIVEANAFYLDHIHAAAH